jgi:phosphate transport system substrate-binding protein
VALSTGRDRVAKTAARFGSGASRHACHGLWRSLLVAIAGAFMATIVAGCAGPRSGPAGTEPTAAASVTTPDLALCGSNTIGSQLGPDLVHGFLTSLGAQDIRSTVSGDEQTLTARLNGRTANMHIAAHGTATAFRGLAAGDCDVGMASRRIKGSEAADLHPLGNMLSPRAEHVIGLDGIAIIVNASNRVSALTMRQLRDIFAGKITAWNLVGGAAHGIHVLARDAKSGTYDTFAALVLAQSPLVASALRFEDSGLLSSTVAGDPDAIGFIGLPFVAHTKALRIASGGSAVPPSKLTVGRESYPLTRRLFLYTAMVPANPLVGNFVSFVQSDPGQMIVDKDGFVGTVTTVAMPTAITTLAMPTAPSHSLPPDAPARYKALVDQYDQTSFNFYFNSGSGALDNKALVDVGRLVDMVTSTRAAHPRKIVLVGFSDSAGGRRENQRLSEYRAKAVATELEAQGLVVEDAIGFGEDLPIRDNATEAGREKNRRVEIFLTR